MTRLFLSFIFGGLVFSANSFPARAENWPQFRGPRGDGTSMEKNVPLRWSVRENIRWKTPVPGEGHSSPIVWGDSIFVTTAFPGSGESLLLRLATDTGEVVWQRTVLRAGTESRHRENSGASSTPVTDGARIVTSFQSGDRVELRCFDFEGNEIWAAQPLAFDGEHGYSYSPVIHDNLVLLDCRQEGEAAFLALDKRTGKTRWRAEPGRRRISHVTPLLVQEGSNWQAIVCGSNEMRSYDPATGELLWWCEGPSDVAVAGLAYGQGMVFGAAGFPMKTRMAVRVSGRGNVTASHVSWSLRRQVTYVPSPVFHDGFLYSVLDDGLLFCFRAESGEAVWDHRLGGRFRSSLVLAGGRVYATDDKARTTVFEATSKGFHPVSANDLEEFCYATPAISGGRVYLRTGTHLYCVESQLDR